MYLQMDYNIPIKVSLFPVDRLLAKKISLEARFNNQFRKNNKRRKGLVDVVSWKIPSCNWSNQFAARNLLANGIYHAYVGS